MKHSLNKWPLVISILIVCTVIDNVSRAIFCIYLAVHAIILHKAYTEVFENKLNEIVDKIHNEFNVTINRFINLK